MSVCGNDKMSSNECDATSPTNTGTIPLTHYQDDSISNLSESLQLPSHPFNTNSSPEKYG